MFETTTATRDEQGKFLPGNQAAKGHKNRAASKRLALSDKFLSTITQKDIAEIVWALIKEAKSGDVAAAREILDRCLGKPKPLEEPEKEINIRIKMPDDLADL